MVITRRVVSYRGECTATGEGWEGHEKDGSGPDCTGECTWLEGDSVEVEPETTEEWVPDRYDLDGRTVTEWMADTLSGSKFPAFTRSSLDGSGNAGRAADAWLEAEEEDVLRGDWRVTITTVRIEGMGWPRVRDILRAVLGRD
jgi:hypothetical protein